MKKKLSTVKKKAILDIENKIIKTSSQKGFYQKGKPFFVLGNDTGILLIHGFDDTAYIMKEYANFFIKKGFTVYNTTLYGRGLTPEHLAETKYEEWIDDARESFLNLKKIVKRTVLIGFSTGATIALNLCGTLAEKDLPDAMIILAPAIFIAHPSIPITIGAMIIKILKLINPFPKKLNNRHLIYVDPVAREKFDHLDRSSFQGVIELLNLIKATKKVVKNIKTPFLVMQSKKDIVISPYSAKWIYKKINVSLKRYVELFKSGHPVVVDIEKKKVFEESYKFILEAFKD
jgi:carboxylesterase